MERVKLHQLPCLSTLTVHRHQTALPQPGRSLTCPSDDSIMYSLGPTGTARELAYGNPDKMTQHEHRHTVSCSLSSAQRMDDASLRLRPDHSGKAE